MLAGLFIIIFWIPIYLYYFQSFLFLSTSHIFNSELVLLPYFTENLSEMKLFAQ